MKNILQLFTQFLICSSMLLSCREGTKESNKLDDLPKLTREIEGLPTSEQDTWSINEPYFRRMSELQSKVLLNGDTSAYDDLVIAYVDEVSQNGFFWAFFMATAYDYPHAHFQVYEIIKYAFIQQNAEWNAAPTKIQDVAIQHLKTAANMGFEPAIEELAEIGN